MKICFHSLSPKYDLFVSHENKVIIYAPVHEEFESITIHDESNYSSDSNTTSESNTRTNSIAASESLLNSPHKSARSTEEKVKGKVLQFSPEDGSFEIDAQYDDYAPTLEAYRLEKKIYGMVGLLDLNFGKYLFYISKRSLVGSFGEKTIFQISKAEYVQVYRKTYVSLNEESLEKTALTQVLELLNSGSFYFSYNYDLSNTFQEFSQKMMNSPDLKIVWPCDIANENFFWNRFLLLPFLLDLHNCKEFILPLICGHVGHFEAPIMFPNMCLLPSATISIAPQDNEVISHILMISRISRRRAGVRYFKRGLDVDGYAAVTVETEVLIKTPSQIASFVSIRASAPWIWGHDIGTVYKLPLIIENLDSTRASEALDKHISKLLNCYGSPLVFVNLLDTRCYEKKLQNTVEVSVCKLQEEQENKIVYFSFDMNKGSYKHSQRFQEINDIFGASSQTFGKIGRFLASCSTSVTTESESVLNSKSRTYLHILQKQSGIYRLNCLDCIDRTNLVQSLLTIKAFAFMVKELGFPFDKMDENSFHEQDVMKAIGMRGLLNLKNICRDIGDKIAKYYAGTPSLTSNHRIRAGILQPFFKKISDTTINISRYYSNRFVDANRQDGIDIMLGNHRGSIQALLDKVSPSYPEISSFSYSSIMVQMENHRSTYPIKKLSSSTGLYSHITIYLILLMRFTAPKSVSSNISFLFVFIWLQILLVWKTFIGDRYNLTILKLPLSGIDNAEGDEVVIKLKDNDKYFII